MGLLGSFFCIVRGTFFSVREKNGASENMSECDKCGVGYMLPSGVCDHCNSKPEYQGQCTCYYTCSNDGGGATLVGVSIIAIMAMVFGIMIGVSVAG